MCVGLACGSDPVDNSDEPAASGGTTASGGSGGAAGTGGTSPILPPDEFEPPVTELPECEGSCTTDCTQGCFDLGACESGPLTFDFHPNAHTLGIVWSANSETPVDSPIYYRPAGFETWFRAHAATPLSDGRAASSLFYLSPDTEYEVRIEGVTGSCKTVSTRPSLPHHETATELHVHAEASGGDGSEASPFATISEALALASPGTDILIRPGIYRESLTIPQSGEEGAFIRLLGEEGAILDGSIDSPELSFAADGASVWQSSFDGDPRYLLRNGSRLYHFTSLEGLRNGIGDDEASIDEGFFVSGGKLYIRGPQAPSPSELQIPQYNAGIALSDVEYVWIRGLTIRYFGEGDYGKGIDIRSSDHVVIEKNSVHDIPSPIWARKGSNDIWVVDNVVYQTRTGIWPWEAVKGTDHENSAITLGGGRGSIVRNNVIYDIFNGVYSGSFDATEDTSIAYDADVYANRFARISDDGLEPEGATINNRFWHNTLDGLHNGISLAPITEGPVWVIRNRFTDFEQSSFKVSNQSSGAVLLYHNSASTSRPDTNGMGQSGYFENMTLRNNIVAGTRYGIEMSQDHGSNDLDYNCWYTPRGAPFIKWQNVRHDDSAAFCAAVELECQGNNLEPGFRDAPAAQLALQAGSPNIDQGERLWGINDAFDGQAPDLGYLEFGEEEVPPLP